MPGESHWELGLSGPWQFRQTGEAGDTGAETATEGTPVLASAASTVTGDCQHRILLHCHAAYTCLFSKEANAI